MCSEIQYSAKVYNAVMSHAVIYSALHNRLLHVTSYVKAGLTDVVTVGTSLPIVVTSHHCPLLSHHTVVTSFHPVRSLVVNSHHCTLLLHLYPFLPVQIITHSCHITVRCCPFTSLPIVLISFNMLLM